jgi:hypothetical protein
VKRDLLNHASSALALWPEAQHGFVGEADGFLYFVVSAAMLADIRAATEGWRRHEPRGWRAADRPNLTATRNRERSEYPSR